MDRNRSLLCQEEWAGAPSVKVRILREIMPLAFFFIGYYLASDPFWYTGSL